MLTDPVLTRDNRVDTEALRRRYPVAEVVAGYGIDLRRVGIALVGRCPFHVDRGRPNLHVYQSGRWICYRCNQRGDVIAFVQRIEDLSFREAVDRLGHRMASHQQSTTDRRISPPTSLRSRRRIELGPVEYRVLAAATELYANGLLANEP